MPREKLLLPKRFAVLAIAAAVALTASAAASDSYVFRDGDITWMFGRGMSSASLQQLQSELGSQFIWARRNARTYIIHDATAIDEARAAIAPHLTRTQQQRRLEKVVDAAIERGAARVIE